jgi:hypothetical protein
VDPNQPPKETVQIPTAGPSPLPKLIEFVQGEEREEGGENVIETESTAVLVSGSGYGVVNAFAWSTSLFADIDSGSGADATFNGAGQMTSVTVNSTTYSMGSGSHADFGTDGIVAWGRWIGPVSIVGSLCEGTCQNTDYTANQGLHYAVGTPTPSLPLTGNASYTLLGATQPTYIDGSTGPGTLTGSLTVDFGAFTVSTNLNVAMPDASYSIRGDSIIASGSAFFFGTTGNGLSCTGPSSSCGARVDGFFAGASAERAGLGYHIDDFGKNEIVGSAAFQKQ